MGMTYPNGQPLPEISFRQGEIAIDTDTGLQMIYLNGRWQPFGDQAIASELAAYKAAFTEVIETMPKGSYSTGGYHMAVTKFRDVLRKHGFTHTGDQP